MRVALHTLGCRLNEAELESWTQQLMADGHEIVHTAPEAQAIILNTCAVTQDAVRKSRNQIRRLRRSNPTAKLLVSGCYATLQEDEIAKELEVDHVVSNKDKNKLVSLLNQYRFAATGTELLENASPALFKLGRQRAFIKVQDGCRYHCTFCIVTIARGEENCRAPGEIITEINNLYEQGIKEIALTGVHLGGYETPEKGKLDQLVTQILRNTNIDRIRLGSLEPWDIPEGLVELFSNDRFMPHLHLPLQSGSDRILKRMARRCSSTRFLQLTEALQKQIPELNITTDIIAGFPGETEEDWQATLELAKRVGFGHIHTFSFSAREGTAASQFKEQLPKSVKKQRNTELHKLASELKKMFIERQLGKTVDVLLEGHPEKNGKEINQILSGYTPNYLRVSVTNVTNNDINEIKKIRLTGLTEDGSLLGEHVSC